MPLGWPAASPREAGRVCDSGLIARLPGAPLGAATAAQPLGKSQVKPDTRTIRSGDNIAIAVTGSQRS